jgi:quercetin dioxygenase-like cupin family protein
MHKKLEAMTMSAAALIGGALLALDAGVATAQTEYVMKNYDTSFASDNAWKDMTAIPAGAKMILVYGDPKEKGPYVVRVKFPAGYKLPAHKHQDPRTVTVLQGTYWSGVGDTFDQGKMTKFTPGSFYTTAAGVPHSAFAETEVIIQEMGQGPVDNPIEYVDASQDPRKK